MHWTGISWMESSHWWRWWWRDEKHWLKIWMDVMRSRASDDPTGGNRGCWMWWEQEVNEVVEGRINFALKWQLTAAEKGTVLKFDSNNMIGSGRFRQNLDGLTERANAHSQLNEEREYSLPDWTKRHVSLSYSYDYIALSRKLSKKLRMRKMKHYHFISQH